MKNKTSEENFIAARRLRWWLFAASLFAAAGGILFFLARKVPGFADTCVHALNPVLVNTLGRISNMFPFSLVEFLIYGILLGILIWAIRFIRKLVSSRPGKRAAAALFLSGLSKLLLLSSIIFLLYEAGEDIGFYCTPFSEQFGYGSGSYETRELAAVCRELAAECNLRSKEVNRDGQGVMMVDRELPVRVVRAMQKLGQMYSQLGGYYCRPKGVFFSELMSRTNMAGIFSAYTYEANYNRDMTPYNIPFTMSHELSHTKGILHENEANFVAFLNCCLSEEPDIRYSGVLSAWVYCGNELYKRDYGEFQKIYNTLERSVILDLNANTAFWESYKSKVTETAQSLNDSFLKNHGQTDGRESYNKVVDLIISWWKTKNNDTLHAMGAAP